MKYRFASLPWFAALHALICEKARMAAIDQPDFSYSICEVFTAVPAELAPAPDGRIAWHSIVRGADVEFELSEIDKADMKAVADYASVLPLASYDTEGVPERAAELQAMSQALVASGHLHISGSLAASGTPLSSLHDAIAKLTTPPGAA
jgi:hypothetical protein